MSTTRKLKLRLPLALMLVCAVLFAVSLMLFNAGVGAAQSPTPSPTPANITPFDTFTQGLGLFVQIATGLTIFVAFVYYLWRGRANDQLKQNNAEMKESLDLKEKRIAELKSDIVEKDAEIRQLERHNEKLRKANLRLQGIEGEE